ncbi:MAG: YggT family protein [Candidatus Zipacnadales bacterium]
MLTLSVVQLIHLVFWLYYILVFLRCIFSWFRTPSYSSPWLPLWRLVYAATELLLYPIRRVLARYTSGMPIDFSPLVLVLLLSVVEQIIIRALARPF